MPVLSINRPGAGGAVGTNSVVQARKDGHTILFAQNARLLRVPFSIRSRSPTMRSGIWCHRHRLTHADHTRRAQRRTVQEFLGVDRIREEQAGQVRIGHPGSGSVGDFCVQLINALTGAELVPIPYAGAAPAIVALRGEHIEGAVLSLGALSAHIKSRAFRGFVASSRFPEFVEIPTMRELGYQEDLSVAGSASSRPQGSPKARGRPWSARSNSGQSTRYRGKTGAARHLAELRHAGADHGRDPRGVQASGRDGQEDRFGRMKPVIQAPKEIIAARLSRRRAHPAPRRKHKGACGIRRVRRALRHGH